MAQARGVMRTLKRWVSTTWGLAVVDIARELMRTELDKSIERRVVREERLDLVVAGEGRGGGHGT
jgi:hypothetical protein